MTVIGYNPNLTKRKITSVNDLFDEKFAGHVGMMSDNTELGSAGLLKLGIDPVKSTPDDWNRAAGLLKKQRPLVRQYYDQSYIKALQDGDTYITQVPSAQPIIKNDFKDPTVAKSPLIFPDSQMQTRFRDYAEFPNFNTFQEWNNIFDPIIQSLGSGPASPDD